MASNISLNQFAPNAKVAGMYAYMANLPQPHNIRVSAKQETALNAGAVLTIDTTVTSQYAPAMKQAGTTDRIDGVLVYNPVQNEFVAGDRIAIARSGDFVFMPAGGEITVGTELYFNDNNEVVATGTGSKIGVAYTTATAQGDLIVVELRFKEAN